jgi:hypothetical protein
MLDQTNIKMLKFLREWLVERVDKLKMLKNLWKKPVSGLDWRIHKLVIKA